MPRVRQVSHLAQHSQGVGAAGYTLAQRSFLGGLLPESLLYVLHTGGPTAWAAAMAGDSDTPELVWTHRMRGQRLVPQVGPGPFYMSWQGSACSDGGHDVNLLLMAS